MFSGSVVVVLPLPSFSVFYCFFFCFVIYGFKGFYFVMGLCCLKFLVKLLKDYSLEICCVFRRFVPLSRSLFPLFLSHNLAKFRLLRFRFVFGFAVVSFLLLFFSFSHFFNSKNSETVTITTKTLKKNK